MTATYLFGVGALLLFWVVSAVITKGKTEPWALAVTESRVDGKPQDVLSASKLQALVWTLVTLFVYGSVFGALLLKTEAGEPIPPLPGIPVHLLVLMGLSVVTAAGSKGLTLSYKAQKRIGERSGGALTDSDGNANLVKTQMLVWTFIGAILYLLTVVKFVDGIAAKSLADIARDGIALPDVDGALLVLMGAAQGAYIGDKLVARDIRKTPKIKEILPLKGAAGTLITIMGDCFGEAQGKSFVALDDTPIETAADGLGPWSDIKLQVTLPTTCKVGDRIRVRVNRDGEWSQEKHTFEVI